MVPFLQYVVYGNFILIPSYPPHFPDTGPALGLDALGGESPDFDEERLFGEGVVVQTVVRGRYGEIVAEGGPEVVHAVIVFLKLACIRLHRAAEPISSSSLSWSWPSGRCLCIIAFGS